MRMTPRRQRFPGNEFAAVALVSLLLSGCSAPLSPEDAAALSTLAEVAGPTSGVAPADVEGTECWLPSDHLIDAGGTAWRVLCRVYWQDGEQDRWQDTTCIGDFALDPMLERCYRWTYYDRMPVFEDEPAVIAR